MEDEQLKVAIAQNQPVRTFLSQFDEVYVQSFIKTYCQHRAQWLDYGQRHLDNKEYHSIQWVSKATTHLGYIQQKKLFDAQCLWRAEQLVIPQIEISYDFKLWEKDILNCPFIEPVSEADITLYSEYLLQLDPLDWRYHDDENWQDHADIIKAYKTDNEHSEFPEWYDFYNGRRGTGVYMTLPDTRGQKEEFYYGLIREKNRKEYAAKNPETIPAKEFKFLSYYDKEQRDWFVENFENGEIQAYYKAVEWGRRNDGLRQDMDYHMHILFNADEPVPVEADKNWSDAIIKAATLYSNRKIVEALPEAWEIYMINIQMNIAFPADNKRFDPNESIRNMYKEGILLGRKLNGEPEDFNF